MGLTAKQLICSIIAIAIGAGIVLGTYRFVGLTVSAYIAIPIVAPIALNGFYDYQGMSFTEMMKRKLRCLFNNPRLFYVSEESEALLNELKAEDERNQAREKKKSASDSKRHKNKGSCKNKNNNNKGYINNSRNTRRKDG